MTFGKTQPIDELLSSINVSNFIEDWNSEMTLVNLAKKYNLPPSKMANAFVNDRPFVTSNIIGATSIEQLKENIDSINVVLSEDLLKEITEIHSEDPNPCV